jgi:ABC-type glycerol-3-phosphate transport system substrate-binding protein
MAASSALAACSPRGQGSAVSAPPDGLNGAGSVSGPITLLATGADPNAQPALRKIYDDFKAQNPSVEWDIRSIAGTGPEWDRLARASIAAGEPIDLLMINGQQVRGWVRDGLLADLGAEPRLADVLARVPEQYHFGGSGESTARAFPLALTDGVHATGIYYNKAILDQAGLGPPRTFSDLKAMVKPLSKLGTAPLVHPSGDVVFNQMLITWVLPMIAEREGDPLEFAESTVRGDIRYDSGQWIEAFETIADLRASGVLLEGSGAVDYGTMQQLFLQGRAAMSYNGSWLLPELLAGEPAAPFDLHVAPPPMVEGASRPRPILAWTGFAMPAESVRNRDGVYAFLEYASRPQVDRAVVDVLQSYSPMAESNSAIVNEVAQEFLPMFDDAITPFDWLWEPEITAEIDNQVQALVKGDTDASAAAHAVQAVADDLRSSGRSYFP